LTRLTKAAFAPFVENSMRIFKAEDFVMLDEIDAIDLQALQDSSSCLAASFLERPSIFV